MHHCHDSLGLSSKVWHQHGEAGQRVGKKIGNGEGASEPGQAANGITTGRRVVPHLGSRPLFSFSLAVAGRAKKPRHESHRVVM